MLGKVRANFLGTEFYIFDDGLNPNKAKIKDQMRAQQGQIHFTTAYYNNVLLHYHLVASRGTDETEKVRGRGYYTSYTGGWTRGALAGIDTCW